MSGFENNPESSSTIKVGKHISAGFLIATMSSFKSIKNKHDVYKDKNVFAHSMLTDIKFSKALVSKIFCSGRFLGSWLNKVGKK